MENKYQKSYLHIYQWLEDDNVGTDDWEDEIKEALKNIEELVDKETPMKPIKCRYYDVKCPNCKEFLPHKKNALKKRKPRVYCDRCGQKLDWSDE